MRFIYLYTILILLTLLAINQRGELSRATPLEYPIRPFVLLSLLVYFWKNSQKIAHQRQRFLATMALGFYWIGDTSFILTDKIPLTILFYITGHILCIAVFHKDNSLLQIFKPKNYMIWLFFLMWNFLFLSYFLLNDSFIIAIFTGIYSVVSAFWLLAAFNRMGCVSRQSEKLVLVGISMFLSTNYLFSLNRFLISLPNSGLITFPLLAIACYCIAEGILKSQKVEKY
jgi:YhhN family